MALGRNPDFRRMPLTLPSVPGDSDGCRHVVLFRKEEDCQRQDRGDPVQDDGARFPCCVEWHGASRDWGVLGHFGTIHLRFLKKPCCRWSLLLDPPRVAFRLEAFITDQPWRYLGRSCCGAAVILYVGA
jgi:hypothetical protein